MEETLAKLARVFGELSLLSFGGGNVTLAEMQRQAVTMNAWLTDAQFGAIYAIAQALPGPSTLFVSLIGLRAAGLLGALVAVTAMYLPSSLAMYAVARFWHDGAKTRIGRAIQRGLAPIAIGMIFAGALAVAEISDNKPHLVVVTVATTAAFILTEWNPILVILTAGAIGFGFGYLPH